MINFKFVEAVKFTVIIPEEIKHKDKKMNGTPLLFHFNFNRLINELLPSAYADK